VGGRVVRVVFDSNVWILYLKGEEDASKLVKTFLKNNVDICVKIDVVIFTSDCSPAWGTPSIESEKFKDMWKQIMEKYVIGGRR